MSASVDPLQHQLLSLNQAPSWIAEDGFQLAEAGLGFSVFTSNSWRQERQSLLTTYQAVLNHLGSGAFKFFATESMSRHRKVAASTLGMLPTWLEEGAPAREFVVLELKGGATPADASANLFKVFDLEPENPDYDPLDAKSLFVSLHPGSHASEKDARWIEQMLLAICARVPFVSALAGPVISRSRYDPEAATFAAWQTAMRCKGLDIQTLVTDGIAVSEQGLKGVGWLTALGNPVLDSLGGRQTVLAMLPKTVAVTELPNGVVLKLADQPSLLDSNRPDDDREVYRATYRVLKPAVEYYIRRSAPLNLPDNEEENTELWLRRFDDV